MTKYSRMIHVDNLERKFIQHMKELSNASAGHGRSRYRGTGQARTAAGTQAISRALAIVKEVAATNASGLRLVDVARAIEVSAPTAHRIAAALVSAGLLRKDPKAHRFHLGDFVISLGLLSDPMIRLREVCRPHLARLAQETGDTAFLVLRSGSDAVCLDRVEGPYPIRALTLDVGSCRPLGVGAGGLAILAALGVDDRALVYAERRDALDAFGRLAPDELERMARASHKRGYAASAGVVIPGVTGVGVVVRLPGQALAALSVAAISQRLDASRVKLVATLLENEARAIEKLFTSR